MLLGEIAVFFVTFAVSSIAFGKWKNGKSKQGVKYPPSLPSLPLVGSLPFLRNFGNLPEFFMEKSKQLGPAFTLRVGNKVILVLNTRKMIEEALLKNSRSFSSRPEIYMERITNPNIKGIAFKDTTSQWKQSHQTTLSIMKEFGFGVKNLMQERILREIEAMTEYVRKKKGESFDPNELSTLLTSNVMMNIAFGRRLDFELGLSDFIAQLDRFAHLLDMAYDLVPFLKYVPSYRKKLSEMVENSKKIYESIETEINKSLKNPGTECFVLRYIEIEGPNYDREQLNFLLRDLVTGGSDTTAITFRWLLLALANNLDIQKKLQVDIDSVIPRDRFPTMQDESKLPYVQATILELYRWRNLLPMSVAHQASSDAFLDGLFVSSGTLVILNLHSVHNNPDEWKDPEIFRPERFLNEEKRVINKHRVINFSLGRRSCLGETLARTEVFLILTSVVQKFNILPPEGQEKVNEAIKLPITMAINTEPFTIRLVERL